MINVRCLLSLKMQQPEGAGKWKSRFYLFRGKKSQFAMNPNWDSEEFSRTEC
jgi:hypothetical protein